MFLINTVKKIARASYGTTIALHQVARSIGTLVCFGKFVSADSSKLLGTGARGGEGRSNREGNNGCYKLDFFFFEDEEEIWMTRPNWEVMS